MFFLFSLTCSHPYFSSFFSVLVSPSSFTFPSVPLASPAIIIPILTPLFSDLTFAPSFSCSPSSLLSSLSAFPLSIHLSSPLLSLSYTPPLSLLLFTHFYRSYFHLTLHLPHFQSSTIFTAFHLYSFYYFFPIFIGFAFSTIRLLLCLICVFSYAILSFFVIFIGSAPVLITQFFLPYFSH